MRAIIDTNVLISAIFWTGKSKQLLNKVRHRLVEPLQVAMDNGAKKALIPIENKRNFFDVSADVLENVDPIFFGDLRAASFKALGLN